jgi:hypothetical protein
MNRILLTLCIILISVFANAQFKKGDILLGGNLSFGTGTSSDTVKGNTGNIGISIGKAVNESGVVGVYVGFQATSQNNYYYENLPLDYHSNSYLAGIFYRKYRSLGKNFFLFGQGSAFFAWSTQSGKNVNGVKNLEGSQTGVGVNIFPGFAYRVSKNFFLELSIPNVFYAQYNTAKTTFESVNQNDYKTFSVGTNLGAGFLSDIGVGFRLVL